MEQKRKLENKGPEKADELSTGSPFFKIDSNPASSQIHPVLQLQSLIGNEAVTALIQTKLLVSEPGDVYEQEADRVAEEFMRMPESPLQKASDETSRKLVRTKAVNTPSTEISPDLEAKIRISEGKGQLLSDSIRAFFEPRFGVDFSNVRVHTDNEADQLNRAFNARAFTARQDVFLRQGEYNAGSSTGKELLAHELTHVAQQVAARTVSTPTIRMAPAKLVFSKQGQLIYIFDADWLIDAFNGHEKTCAALLKIKSSNAELYMGGKQYLEFLNVPEPERQLRMVFLNNQNIKFAPPPSIEDIEEAFQLWKKPSQPKLAALYEEAGDTDLIANAKSLQRINPNARVEIVTNNKAHFDPRQIDSHFTIKVSDYSLTTKTKKPPAKTILPGKKTAISGFTGKTSYSKSTSRRIRRLSSKIKGGIKGITGRLGHLPFAGLWIAIATFIFMELLSWYVEEKERLRILQDFNKLLPRIKNELEKAKRDMLTEELESSWVNIDVRTDFLWHTEMDSPTERVYLGTQLKRVDIDLKDGSGINVDSEDTFVGQHRETISTVVSFPFNQVYSELVKANLETLSLSTDEEIHSWIFGHNLSEIRSIPEIEKIRLIDALFSLGCDERDWLAIIKICSSVEKREEAVRINSVFDNETSPHYYRKFAVDQTARFKIGGALIDMVRNSK